MRKILCFNFSVILLCLFFVNFLNAIDLIVINDSKNHDITVVVKKADYVKTDYSKNGTSTFEELNKNGHKVKRGHFSFFKNCDLLQVSFWKMRLFKMHCIIPSTISEIKIDFGIIPEKTEVVVVRISREYEKNYKVMNFLPCRKNMNTILCDREKLKLLISTVIEKVRKIKVRLDLKSYKNLGELESQTKILADIDKLGNIGEEYTDILKTKLSFSALKDKLKQRFLDIQSEVKMGYSHANLEKYLKEKHKTKQSNL